MPRQPKQRNEANDYEKEFLRIVDEFGWHVTSVFPSTGDEDRDAWSYTTGLFYHYRHPEIIVFNEPSDLRHS